VISSGLRPQYGYLGLSMGHSFLPIALSLSLSLSDTPQAACTICLSVCLSVSLFLGQVSSF